MEFLVTRMKKKGIVKIVSQKRPWYERLLAAVFFAIAVYIIFLFYLNNPLDYTTEYYRKSFLVLAFLIFVLSFGFRFSYTIHHHFDLKLNRYRAYWSVGPFGKGNWVKTHKLDRVSTFLNSRNECEVNIWDIKNNRYRITYFDKIDEAVKFGRELAEKLNIPFKERK